MDFENTPFKAYPETRLAISTAIKAGKVILEIYNQDFSSYIKEDKEPITEADLRSHDIIQAQLSTMKYPIISEESKERKALNNDSVWIVDPLDGTSDFISRTGEFSVMISFVKDHIPVIGVVYQPVNGLLYVAQKGCGAYNVINGRWVKLAVNGKLEDYKAIVSRHHLVEQEKTFLNLLNVSSFVQKGSCGLKVAEICKGDAELYFTTTDKIKQWDTCAAYCLVNEAGGKMTDMLGNDLKYNLGALNHQNGILVTNGVLHAKVIEKYKDFLRR